MADCGFNAEKSFIVDAAKRNELKADATKMKMTDQKQTDAVKIEDSGIQEHAGIPETSEDRKIDKKVRYLEEAVRVMHKALHSGMWGMEFDRNGKMYSVSWSPEFRQMVGFETEEEFPNVLESWSGRLHKEDYERVLKEFNDTVNDYTDKKTYDVEYRMKVRSGEWRWFHAMGRLIRRKDGTPRSYIGMFVDITESKEQEAKLVDALHRAEAANKAKTSFLSHMSHDIRTPINGIMGMTTIALRHLDDSARVEDCLQKIDHSSQHLLSLVNDVLDLSRIDAGKVSIAHDPFDLISLIGDCSSIIQGQLTGRNINFETDTTRITHHRLIGDALHMRQIFINILGNSVKFTNEGDSIFLRVYELGQAGQLPEDDSAQSAALNGNAIVSASDKGDAAVSASENGAAVVSASDKGDAAVSPSAIWYRFELEDTGIGMSEEYLPKLFESFSQENDGIRTHYAGTGLGMAITKQFVEMLHGSIRVESKLGVGTKTTIEFPIDPDPEAPEDTAEESVNAINISLDGMRILVAEDNEINMEIVTMILEEAGAVVTQAFNGQEALDLFRNSEDGQFEAILMDVMMPVMDGLEASRQIRALPRPDAKEIPIIAATANAYTEDIQKAHEAGMNAHVAKPLVIDQLLSVLKKYQSFSRRLK